MARTVNERPCLGDGSEREWAEGVPDKSWSGKEGWVMKNSPATVMGTSISGRRNIRGKGQEVAMVGRWCTPNEGRRGAGRGHIGQGFASFGVSLHTFYVQQKATGGCKAETHYYLTSIFKDHYGPWVPNGF